MTNGITPKTFGDAFIFSISKGGEKSDPLNYRPIALLNTDYKIFTRVLAWRVRRHIDRLVHRTQFGFVPGRTIHEAIDLLEAAKITCKRRQDLSEAQVLMLDFAKAYDSLDRDFLLKVIRAKGLPPKFCAIVTAIHQGTQVQFLANGSLSKPVAMRKACRTIYLAKRRDQAINAVMHVQQQWRGQNAEIAEALQKLNWKRVQQLQGIPAYQQQNICRLKHNRLRLWNKEVKSFGCAVCGEEMNAGTEHLIWTFQAAGSFWDGLLKFWGYGDISESGPQATRENALHDIFSMKLKTIPAWLVEWMNKQEAEIWEQAQQIMQELWAIGCAATIAAIWVWNVKHLHPDGREQLTVVEATAKQTKMLTEAINRYWIGLMPITQASKPKVDIVAFFARKTGKVVHAARASLGRSRMERLAFSDGGSRGNPGPGGSGSIIITLHEQNKSTEISWAAATALGHKALTNNVAEFVGLQRLLARAVECKWSGMHVIGDSAMIINMMKDRKQPKSNTGTG